MSKGKREVKVWQLVCKDSRALAIKFRRNCINDALAEYDIPGISLDAIIGLDLEDMNRKFCDDAVPYGFLLEDISYDFSGFDEKTKTVTIRVTADATGWLTENGAGVK